MERVRKFNVVYVLFALMGVMVLHDLWTARHAAISLPYSEFQTLLREGKVAEVVISADRIAGELKEPREGKNRFVTTRVDPALTSELDKAGVKYSGAIESQLLPMLLSWLVPLLLFGGVWWFIARRLRGAAGGGLMAIGKSKAKVYVETGVPVRFSDVAGVDEAKAELKETVAFLRDPSSYGRLGARMPKGVLLVGPPGTGKTLLARAVAGEAGVPFFSITGSEFVEMFVGVGAARVRDLFEQARTKAPCIIFIDELDALGRARNASSMLGGHDEKEQTLNQLLAEMDGFDPTAGIVLLAATNRPEVLDPALLRAGRFDRQVLVDRPDRTGRRDILAVHVRKVSMAADVELEKVAALTPGFTGADLANLVNEAALAATRRGAAAVSLADFTVALERIVAGLERRSRLIEPRERAVIAHHEMGHALVAGAVPGADPVHKISIIPRGIGALGYTLQRPSDDRYIQTRAELEGRIAVLLGGRAAELLVFGQFSTGAADDLAKASDLARTMVTRYGMAPEVGHVAYDSSGPGFLGPSGFNRREYAEQTAREIDLAVRRLVDSGLDRARTILAANRPLLEKGAQLLLAKETLEEADLATLFVQLRHPEPEERTGPEIPSGEAVAVPA